MNTSIQQIYSENQSANFFTYKSTLWGIIHNFSRIFRCVVFVINDFFSAKNINNETFSTLLENYE